MKRARVRTVAGVPRLEIDGKPTRARLFWGGVNAAPVPIDSPREIAFSFTAPLTTTTATLHFRFGQTPGAVRIHHVEIVEDESGRNALAGTHTWNVWPPPERNTVGTVEVDVDGFRARITAPPTGAEWPDFHVFHAHTIALTHGKVYRVRLVASAQPARDVTIALYQPGSTYTFLAGPSERFERQVRLAAGAGVNLVSFEVSLPWPEPGEAEDFRASDAACERALVANPSALLLPRISVYPPPAWLQRNPGDVMRWDDGVHGGTIASAASERYRRDGAERLTALIRHLEGRYGERIVGYHPCGQNTGEWFWMDSWTGALPGYSRCDRVMWQAWRDDQGLPSAPVPSPAERRATVPSPNVVAFNRFLSETIADAALTMARAVREATAGNKLSLLFYGYGFEFAAMPSGPANSGHYALRQILASPDVDIVCGPFSYNDRSVGGTGPVMSAAESVLAAGKLWLNEDDTRTFLARERTFPGWDSGAEDLPKSVGILTRNLAQNAFRNHATWWMDLPGTGWFDAPELWTVMRAFEKIDAWFLSHPTPFRPEIALVLDEEAAFRLTPNAARNAPLSNARIALGRLGAPFGQYLLDDVVAGRCPARLLVAVLGGALTPARRAALERAARGRTLVVVGEESVSTATLREAARTAGVHRYTDTDAVVFANGPFVAVHAVVDGPVALTLRRGGTVIDALSGAPVGMGPKLSLTLNRGETRVLQNG